VKLYFEPILAVLNAWLKLIVRDEPGTSNATPDFRLKNDLRSVELPAASSWTYNILLLVFLSISVNVWVLPFLLRLSLWFQETWLTTRFVLVEEETVTLIVAECVMSPLVPVTVTM